MKWAKGQILHVFNQGNNRQTIFFEDANYEYFLNKVKKYILPYADIIAYCLMPNHFHFLLTPNERASQVCRAVKPRKKYDEFGKLNVGNDVDYQENLSWALGTLLSSYTKAVNLRYGRTGSLFRPRTKVRNGAVDNFITLDGPYRPLFYRDGYDYARTCLRYIHANPVKASLVNIAEEWPYSSAKEYAGRLDKGLCNLEIANRFGLDQIWGEEKII